MFGRGVELVGVVELVLAGGVGEVWHGVGGEGDVGRGAQAAAGARRTTPWRTYERRAGVRGSSGTNWRHFSLLIKQMNRTWNLDLRDVDLNLMYLNVLEMYLNNMTSV